MSYACDGYVVSYRVSPRSIGDSARAPVPPDYLRSAVPLRGAARSAAPVVQLISDYAGIDSTLLGSAIDHSNRSRLAASARLDAGALLCVERHSVRSARLTQSQCLRASTHRRVGRLYSGDRGSPARAFLICVFKLIESNRVESINLREREREKRMPMKRLLRANDFRRALTLTSQLGTYQPGLSAVDAVIISRKTSPDSE